MQLNNQVIQRVCYAIGEVAVKHEVGNEHVTRIIVREAINSGGYKISVYEDNDTVSTPSVVVLTNQVMIEYKRKHHEPVGLDL